MNDFLERISKLSPKRLALLASELNSSLERVKSRASEPLAIIGMGCRFPGGANDPESFWRLLIEGRDAISEVPPERWDIDAYYDANPDTPGKMYTRWGGFLSGIDLFDPEFFSISPREAAGMDPQQRVLLEVAWEALEHAGQSPELLAGSRTGVFVGLCNNDYYLLMQSEGGPGSLDANVATGNAHSIAAGRISYVLGLLGPSIAVDTSCSASLMAVHLACQSLRLGESRMALAGGVNLILNPAITVTLSKAHMMSPDGRCKAFDASGDGFVRAEGCGLVVLKRLSDARADGDRILALIRGTASNQDGKSNGLTAPNGPSQVALVEEALANAGLQPADVDFIEAHGTGTSLGDPIEAGALAEVFGPGRPVECPLHVGAVKTNIGHAESAAGIAGLIKTVLALQHGRIPPNLHFNRLNPGIDWAGSAIHVAAAETPWNREKGSRAAGVSSFGFSGTNVHVILSDPPVEPPVSEDSGEPSTQSPYHLLPLSARTGSALVGLAREFEEAFRNEPDLELADVCYTAGTGRSHFDHRLAMVASSLGEAREQLAAFQRGEKNSRLSNGRAKTSSVPGVVFMFTGQGSQYVGMGRELFETQPVFRRELERCAEILRPLLEKPLLEVMFADPREAGNSAQLLDETRYTQPALFALEYALAALWRSWGVEPVAVLGHSVGEYVAACVAGVFSLEDALHLIAVRARLMQALPPGGAMAAVLAGEDQVRKAIAGYGDSVSVAGVNSPRNTVISGKAEVVAAVVESLRREGAEAKLLSVSHAFHSSLIDPALDEFEQFARSVPHQHPVIDIVLNTTGRFFDESSPVNYNHWAAYWRRHARQAVRFSDSITTLRARGMRVFLEIGPAPVLTGMARQCAKDSDVTWLSSLRMDQRASQQMLSSLASLFTLGLKPDWNGVDQRPVRSRIALPTYPFQRQRHWMEMRPKNSQGQQQVLQMDDWLYEERWELKPTGSAETAFDDPRRGAWMIVALDDKSCLPLAEALRARGESVAVAKSGATWHRNSDDSITLNPDRIEDCRRLLSEVSRDETLRGLVIVGPQYDPSIPFDLSFTRGVVHLAKALGENSGDAPERLWVLTAGAQRVLPSEQPSTSQAPVLGLVRSLVLEQATAGWTSVDLDPQTPPADAAALVLEELLTGGNEAELAFRKGNRYVRRLARASVRPAEVNAGRIRSDATYLITGGLGAIGIAMARWLVEEGARHLVLVGRAGARGKSAETIEEFERQGVSVRVMRADVSDEALMKEAFSDIMETMPPLAGIIHAAGVLEDGLITNLSWESFERVFAPKVQGGWILHELTKNLELDFFVLFSSAASFFGAAGQSNYAGANAYLDALAYHRRALGLPGVSLNWGPWAGAGMAKAAGIRREAQWRQAGLATMTAEQGLEALQRLLREGPAQVAVLDIDWEKFLAPGGSRNQPLYSAFRHSTEGFKNNLHAGVTMAHGIRRFEQGPIAERRNLLFEHICNEAALVLGIASGGQIDPEQGLFDLGMDSLTAIELKNRLQKSFEKPLSSTLFFDYPNVQKLTEYLACEVLRWNEDAPIPDTPFESEKQTRDFEEFSEDELAELLAQKLQQLQ